MKPILLMVAVVWLTGCASHAKIKMKGMMPVASEQFSGKSFHHDIYYTQPKPGMFFAGGDEMPMKPLSEAELSVHSSSVLLKFPDYIKKQLPVSATIGTDKMHDYLIRVELTAYNKMGPAYYEHEFFKSVFFGVLTLGLSPSLYDLKAEFDVTYSLLDADGKILYTKSYNVDEKLDHQMSAFDKMALLSDLSQQLFEKHLLETMNDFLLNASA